MIPGEWAIVVAGNPDGSRDDKLANLLTQANLHQRRHVAVTVRPLDIAREIRRAWFDGADGVLVVADPEERRWARVVVATGIAWDRLAEGGRTRLPVGAEALEGTDAPAFLLRDDRRCTIASSPASVPTALAEGLRLLA